MVVVIALLALLSVLAALLAVAVVRSARSAAAAIPRLQHDHGARPGGSAVIRRCRLLGGDRVHGGRSGLSAEHYLRCSNLRSRVARPAGRARAL
jgi:hypothetical protein